MQEQPAATYAFELVNRLLVVHSEVTHLSNAGLAARFEARVAQCAAAVRGFPLDALILDGALVAEVDVLVCDVARASRSRRLIDLVRPRVTERRARL